MKFGSFSAKFYVFLVISNNIVAKYTKLVMVAPISTTKRRLSLYIALPDDIDTKGTVLLDQITAIDYVARNAEIREKVSEEFLDKILDVARRIFKK